MVHCHKGLQVYHFEISRDILYYHLLRVRAIPTYRVYWLYNLNWQTDDSFLKTFKNIPRRDTFCQKKVAKGVVNMLLNSQTPTDDVKSY